MTEEQIEFLKNLTASEFEQMSADKKMTVLDTVVVMLGGILAQTLIDAIGGGLYMRPLFHNQTDGKALVLVAEGEAAVFVNQLINERLKEQMRQKERQENETIIDLGKKQTIFH